MSALANHNCKRRLVCQRLVWRTQATALSASSKLKRMHSIFPCGCLLKLFGLFIVLVSFVTCSRPTILVVKLLLVCTSDSITQNHSHLIGSESSIVRQQLAALLLGRASKQSLDGVRDSMAPLRSCRVNARQRSNLAGNPTGLTARQTCFAH